MARPPVPMFSAKPAVPKFDAQARQRADDDEVRAPLRSRARGVRERLAARVRAASRRARADLPTRRSAPVPPLALDWLLLGVAAECGAACRISARASKSWGSLRPCTTTM